MSIDKIEQDSCSDCQDADHCFVCDCCRYPDDDQEPDPFPVGTRVTIYEVPGGYVVARAKDLE